MAVGGHQNDSFDLMVGQEVEDLVAFVFEAVPGIEAVAFGRGQDCDKTIDHPTISREHAEILYHNGQFLLRDFSTNGSHVIQGDNQEQIHRSSVELKGKGQIFLGRTLDQPEYCIEFTCIESR